MTFFDPLLGFAVLTGPLWFLVLMVPAAIGIAVIVAKRVRRTGARLPVGLGVFVLVYALPFADEMAGRIYLNYLCATQAGVRMYHTVELPAEYWDEDGKPKFFNQYGNLDHELWVKVLDESAGRVERYASVLVIDKDISPVKGRGSEKVLAEVTTFRYWGGWMRRNFSPNNTANSCEFISDPNFSRSFYGQLFKPAIHSNHSRSK